MKFGEVMKHHLLRDKENRLLELNSSSSQYIYQVMIRKLIDSKEFS